MTLIYKIVPASLWRKAEAAGLFEGAAIDFEDGYIHFSTAEQVRETAARHFAGQDDLLLVAVEAERLGPSLRWELSRGGALFPHLYAALRPGEAAGVGALRRGPDGLFEFPDDIPGASPIKS